MGSQPGFIRLHALPICKGLGPTAATRMGNFQDGDVTAVPLTLTSRPKRPDPPTIYLIRKTSFCTENQ